ncbi:hypothetical protein FHS82_003944 [Pseudochelatococcus lubricantis]|uniref:Uncharacterized protein n=1 Tax=Pseudochelatococcus lubricantis TaxID=1538102 RepID=A0ABX0V4D2_9HYPH|nr:hypothetical protein [Pseudochelatococcus lubricantis]
MADIGIKVSLDGLDSASVLLSRIVGMSERDLLD